MGGTLGQWAVHSVSGRYPRLVGGTFGQWAVHSVSGRYPRSVGSTLGQWAVHSVSGRYIRSVGGTLGRCSCELGPGSKRCTAEVALHDSEDLFRAVPGTPNLQWGSYISLFDRR